jgi:putative SOS response-associated peptidase YedK
MCGRFVGFRHIEELMAYFPIDVADAEVTENYNVAPTQEVLSIIRQADGNHLVRLNWGLVPFWAKDRSIGNRMINARSETAAGKPSFRAAFKKRRCMILADGFYEWAGDKGNKQPMYLTLPDSNPFAFAGLWETWETWDNEGTAEFHRSCTILTREASESVRDIHNRMPVILKPDAYGAWLEPSNQDADALQALIREQIHTELKAVAVSKQVNSVKHNRPENILPVQK